MVLEAGLAAASVVVGIVALLLPRALARGRVARIEQTLGDAVRRRGELEKLDAGATVTIVGKLDAAGPIATYHPYGASLMEEVHVYAKTPDTHDARVSLEGTSVELAGPLQVLLGTAETGRSADAARAARSLGIDSIAEMRDATRGQFRVVRPGDVVRARGLLAFRAPEGGETGYRDGARAFELRASSDPGWPARPIPIVATEARGRASRFGLAVATLLALLAVAASVRIDVRVPGRPARASLAQDALFRANTAWEHADFDAAAKAFAEARELDPTISPTTSEIESYALSGDDVRAHDVTTVMAETRYPGPSTPEKERLECIAAAYARRHGDPHPLQRFVDGYGSPVECEIIAQDFGGRTGGSGRTDWGFGMRFEAERWNNLTRANANMAAYFGAALFPDGWVLDRPYALDASVLAKHGPYDDRYDQGWPADAMIRDEAERRVALASYDIEIAIFLAYMGKPAREVVTHFAALRDLDKFETDNAAAIHEGFAHEFDGADDEWKTDEENYTYSIQLLHAGAAAAALLARDPDVRARLAGAEAHTRGTIEHHLDLVASPWETPVDPERFEWPHHDLFAAADKGTAALADALASSRIVNPTVVQELVARARGDRPPLVDWVEHRFPKPCDDCGLMALAVNVGARLADARTLGDTRLEAELQPVADRITEAELRRDGAPELFVLERDPARK